MHAAWGCKLQNASSLLFHGIPKGAGTRSNDGVRLQSDRGTQGVVDPGAELHMMASVLHMRAEAMKGRCTLLPNMGDPASAQQPCSIGA